LGVLYLKMVFFRTCLALCVGVLIMKKQLSFVLSTIIGLGMCASASVVQANTTHNKTLPELQIAYVASGGTVRMYNGSRLRYYPNHVIVADTYDREVIQNIAKLARELGWDVVYLQVPEEYREYANTYFVDYGIGVNYFAVSMNPDDTLGMFYGTRGYPGYHGYGDHRDHREYRHEHRHDHHNDRHHKHHNKAKAHENNMNKKGEQHKMHHSNGEGHGNKYGHGHHGHRDHHVHGHGEHPGHGGHRHGGHGGHGGHGHGGHR